MASTVPLVPPQRSAQPLDRTRETVVSPWVRAAAARSLSTAEQRAAVPASADLLPTRKGARAALSIKPLPVDVIDTLAKIGPDHAVVRAVLLRRPLGSKQAQLGRRIVRKACSRQSCNEPDPCPHIGCATLSNGPGAVHGRDRHDAGPAATTQPTVRARQQAGLTTGSAAALTRTDLPHAALKRVMIAISQVERD